MLAGETIERFDADTRMASVLASLAFMRAVDSEAGRSQDNLEPKDKTELLKVAGRLVELSAKLKEQRLDVLDRYENLNDVPKPANLEYMVTTVSPKLQVKRLLLVKMDAEAEALARQHEIDIEDVRESIASGEHDGT